MTGAADQLASGLLDAAPDAIVGVNADGVIVLVNAQAERLFGYPREDLLGQQIEVLIPHRARHIHPDRRAGYVADPRPRPMASGMDITARRRDATEFPVEISLSAIETEDGIVVSAAVRDVTERKRIEARYRGLLEAAPDAMVGVNADGVIVLVNAQAERLFGYPREELFGQQIEMLVPQGVRHLHPDRRAGYLADPHPREMGAGLEITARRRDGTEFPVEISLSAIETEDGTVVSAAVRDVTERKGAEARYRRLLEAAPDAIVGVNADGVIVLLNAQCERLFGYPREDLLGQQIEILVPQGVRHLHPGRRAGYLADPHPREMGAGLEITGRRRDGTEFPVEISLSAIETEDGIVVSAAVRDATERRRAEARFRRLLEAAPDAMVGVNAEGVIVLVNTQCERLFGYRRDELLGQQIEILVPQGVRHLHPGRRAGYVADPRPRPMGAGLEIAGRRRDGTEFPVEISLSAIETEDGIVVSAAVRDVTERKRAEARFRGLLEAAPDAMVGVNAEGVMVLVNTQCERLFGYRREELLGQQIEMLVPRSMRYLHPSRRAGYMADPRPRLMGAGMDLAGRELAGRRRDGSEFPAEIALSAFVTEDGVVVSASVRDVSDRRRIEQQLRDKNAELETVSRTKDTFLASMSHELRTPLNAIIGFTGTLLMELPGPLNAAQDRQLRIVENSGKHLLSIINDLLDLAKIESGAVELALEPVDCVEVIETVMASLQPLAEDKGLVFTAKLPQQRLVVRSNTRALGQILINLVSNAIKFTDAGHVLVELRADQEGSGPSIIVADSGPGIAADDLDHLFNAFERGRASGASTQEGTGLGLHISRKIAEIIEAEITVSSRFGSGTAFAVALKEQP